ncbi:MAG: DUF1730 domain-containing protein, partial [Acidobacteria bacterium]
MGNSELTSCIRTEALQLGFDAVGFALAQPLPGVQFREWLDRGYHGEMAYMASNVERRLDPSQVLPGARSVISVALLYRHPHVAPETPPDRFDRGRISCYAQGTDYHLVLQNKLEELLSFIQRLSPEAQT